MISKRDFTIQDYILIILILAYTVFTFYSKNLIVEYGNNTLVVTGLRFLKCILAILLCIVTYYSNSSFFKNQWLIFKKRTWIKYLWIILCWIGTLIILNLSRTIIKWLFDIKLLHNWVVISQEETNLDLPSILNIIIIGINLLVLPLGKEYIYRHILFLKHINNPSKMILYAIIGGVLYAWGFYFINDNIISIIPYFLSSTLYYLFYLHSNNIWYPIFAHILFTMVVFITNITDSFLLPYLS